MSCLSIQDDFEQWDDFTATQLEQVEFHTANDEIMTEQESVFPYNSSKAAFDIFLDELITTPIKSKIKSAPLGDITNKQKLSSTVDKKAQKPPAPPAPITRMDSLDDSIWAEFDTDLISIIDTKCDTTKVDLDESFRLKHQKVSTFPSFTTAKGVELPPPSKEARLKYAKLLETVDVDLSSSINEALFIPPKLDNVPLKEVNNPQPEEVTDSFNDIICPPVSIVKLPPPPVSLSFTSQSSKDDSDFSLTSYDDLFLPPMYSYKLLSRDPILSSNTDKDDLSSNKTILDSHATNEYSIKSFDSFHEDKNNLIEHNSSNKVKYLSEYTKQTHTVLEESASVNDPFDVKKYTHVMNQFGGFQTAKGKKSFEISSQAKRKAISILDKEENKKIRSIEPSNIKPDTKQYEHNITQFGGFKTANSKKSFDISSQAKRAAISVLDKDDNSFDFTTASSTSIKHNIENGKQTATLLLQDIKKYDYEINQFGGFKTASGKNNFDISSQAKRTAIAVLDKVEPESQPFTCSKFTTASGTSIKPPTENGKQAANSLFEDSKKYDHDINQFGGFKTASGKNNFDISSQAKRTAIAVLDKENQMDKSNTPPKFTTASGTSINPPSEKGKQRTNALFQEAKEFDDSVHQFGGFQTGSGKKNFEISSQAKRKAISILDEPLPSNIVIPLKTDLSGILESPIDIFSKEYTVNNKKPLPKNEDIKPMTPPKASMPEDHPKKVAVPEPSVPMFPKRNSRPSIVKRQNKPFKSPISNLELTKAAVINRATSKAKLTPVFDLKAPSERNKLSVLGKPGQFSKSQLVAKKIPIAVIYMTANTAKKYSFDMKWGPKEARDDLIEAGAVSRRISYEWVENHYACIVWKLACQIRSYPDRFIEHWESRYVLNQLLYRYEREINMGHRPVLRRILEKDDLPIKHMILVVSDIIEIKSALQYNTSSKYRLQLSDGWYQVPTCIDLRMEKAITKKKLKIGSKLSICGASLIGDKEGIHPLENTDNSAILSITTNSSLPAHWDTKLGYHPRRLITRSIQTIFYDGGTVTALDIIVCRKFPILYSEVLPNGSIVTRNAKEEEEARRAALGYEGYGSRQPKSESQPERRVSGYFKLRICDTKSSPDQQLATLVLSNASELNHMDISEGNRYKIFFVIPYYPKNKKYPGLDLKTTRITRWEPAPAMNMRNAYVPRFLTLCSDIRLKDPSSDFDLVVLVLQTGQATLETLNGRKLWHQTLLVTDQSQAICQIEFRLPMNPFTNINGQVFGLMNLRFEMYDSKFDITLLKATDESESVSKVSSAFEYIQKGVVKLKKWVLDHPSQVQSVTDRIHNLLQ